MKTYECFFGFIKKLITYVMKYIKKYEKKQKNIKLFDCEDFNITLQSNDTISFNTRFLACSAVMGMAILVSSSELENKYSSNTDLRNVELREKDIYEVIRYLTLDSFKRQNIKQNKTGAIEYFLTKEDLNSIPETVYMTLTEKYYPILIDAVSKSHTFGDIIDYFTIIYNQLIPDLNMELSTSKYNL